ncbi:MAG: transcription-repair coupling factor [Syntrophales bacterium]|nr:transcription-repair coupling factor [Syntrophales bacterium]
MRKKVEQKERSNDPVLNSFFENLSSEKETLLLTGLQGSSAALVLSLVFKRLNRTILVTLSSQKEAESLFGDLQFFLEPGNVFIHMAWDIRLFSSDEILSFDQEAVQSRMRVLTRLMTGKPMIVVSSTEALLQRVIPMSALVDYLEIISQGDSLERSRLENKLLEGGYQRVPLVEEPGEFSLRGFIADIYSPAEDSPVRIEFFGDEIESIREFNPETQRSLKEISSFMMAPAGEILFTEESKNLALRHLRVRAADLGLSRARRDALAGFIETGILPATAAQFLPLYYDEPSMAESTHRSFETIIDYLPKNGFLAFLDRIGIEQTERDLIGKIEGYTEKAREEERFYLEKSSLFSSLEMVKQRSQGLHKLVFDDAREHHQSRAFNFSIETQIGLIQSEFRSEHDGGLLLPFVERVKTWMKEGVTTFFLCGEEEIRRITHIFEGYGLTVEQSSRPFFLDLERYKGKGTFLIKPGRISEGFHYGSMKLALVCDEDLFGKKIKRRKKPSLREGYFLRSFGELKEGDFIVHMDHGIGLYQGLKRLSAAGIENDFILLEYSGGDKLYLPVDRLDQIQRYVGPDGFAPPTDRLGGSSWEAVKKRVSESVRKIAEDLLALYAAREVMEGHSFSMNERACDEFAASFEFEETPDQIRAINDIDDDMTDARPMDRLICGDAGFGKTETALRASFRAVMDGTQVALLVPTTILAEQHYRTFASRFSSWPVRVEVLNRFKSKKEQQTIVSDIKRGLVDIVIGTHRLLQKDVAFRNLGLVIIDEEQRFGVAHKEKLKKLRKLVDVMTLTATPIPRTLQLSLVGLRDLSVIDTPPEGRQAVRVYVAEFDEDLIRDAIEEEMNRGGQVFFIHDRIRSIEGMARSVQRIVPGARVAFAHGRMKTGELEKIMISFLDRRIDILVCTTIIGSGVDIPAANTIIINRADRFGLSQLYQLRGRVGRSSESAAAYLLIPKGAVLTKDARKRLRVARDLTNPGSGLKVAAHDLEIRGAGNILGVSQSGHVSAVGYELYTEMMEQAVMELRGLKPEDRSIQPEIRLGVPAFIPDEYVQDTQSRLVIYKKASMASSGGELSDLRYELSDRYGPVPPAVDNLLSIINIKIRLRQIKAREIAYDGKNFTMAFAYDTPVSPETIIEMSRKRKNEMRFTADNRLSLYMPGLDYEGCIREAGKILDLLS